MNRLRALPQQHFLLQKIYHLISPSSKNTQRARMCVCVAQTHFTIWTVVLCLRSHRSKNSRCVANVNLPGQKENTSGLVFVSYRAKNLILSRSTISKFLRGIGFSNCCEKQSKKISHTQTHMRGRKRSVRTWSFSSVWFFLSTWGLPTERQINQFW